MAPDRNKRYSTADEMLADLEAFRKDPNINFEPGSEPSKGSRLVSIS